MRSNSQKITSVKLELRNEFGKGEPPNSECQIMLHPSGNRNNCIDVSLFNDHRFAFYYWLKWNSVEDYGRSPDLVSFDWHQDFAYPCTTLRKELDKLNVNNPFEVSFFAWARLNSLNDDHILAAAYLNKVNDIWIVCKQGRQPEDWKDEELIDKYGNKHNVRKFRDQQSLFSEIRNTNIESLFFDIDLDYFTIDNSTSNDKHIFTYMSNEEIETIFDTDGDFMQWIFKRMEGFTIALEPVHTGGISNCMKYLELLNKIFFNGDILHRDCCWKHLTLISPKSSNV